ncbi:DUF4167 domain-containing protein [Pseudopelagicola sp. nBUS_19]|uniref:DUF4167 domain-containing protein n=1 Tax=Pseudopelagicola sp. nBUS_19 TaxID=3395316 RepID=UPI003EBFF937
MRSSKSRPRNKPNRNRPSGNIVNRVFDSSGPEGKVRGTPQQIIDKYNQLTRDAQLGNDRVAAENFQQHAEHYLRMLNEAQREQEARREEQEARREEQERQNRERQAERDRERRERMDRQEREAGGRETEELPEVILDPSESEQPDLIVDSPEDKLVETPEVVAESKPKIPRKTTPRRRSSTAVKKKADDTTVADVDSVEQSSASEGNAAE